MKKLACTTCKGNCMGCFHADECNKYNDIAPYNPLEIEVNTASMELCKGRHSTPATDGAIFETEVKPLDVSALESKAKKETCKPEYYKIKLVCYGFNSRIDCRS